MKLTKQNFKLFAAKHYDNESCLNSDEFESDLNQIKVIKRMMTRYSNGEESNLKLLVNNVVTFFNCFTVEGATELIEFSVEPEQFEKFNSIFLFLSQPLIGNRKIDPVLLSLLSKEFSE